MRGSWIWWTIAAGCADKTGADGVIGESGVISHDEDGIGETALSYDLPELLLSPTLLMTDENETIEYVERGRRR